MILGIFYARFLPQEGIKIVHQKPPGCIVPEEGYESAQLLHFEAVTDFVIPRQSFCNRYITGRDPSGDYRILGFPVCVHNEKYARNEFIFNFGIIISTDHDTAPYEPVIRRLATTFTEMEVQTQFLSQEGVADHQQRSIGGLLEIIREDLNNYNECMIPVDKSNTINMKLFPVQCDPPPVKPWHVPIAKIRFDEIVDDRWDLTMRKVIPLIDGVRDVRRIAAEADVSLELTKLTLRHLLYYKTVMLVDMFFFNNIYAVTPLIRDFVNNVDNMQDECAAYVLAQRPKAVGYQLCRLLGTFGQGRTIREWLRLHIDDGQTAVDGLDVRRLVQFGVIKSLLRRVHKFPVSAQYVADLAEGRVVVDEGKGKGKAQGEEEAEPLEKYTDGRHHFDQIITEVNLGEAEIMRGLSRLSAADVQIVYRHLVAASENLVAAAGNSVPASEYQNTQPTSTYQVEKHLVAGPVHLVPASENKTMPYKPTQQVEKHLVAGSEHQTTPHMPTPVPKRPCNPNPITNPISHPRGTIAVFREGSTVCLSPGTSAPRTCSPRRTDIASPQDPSTTGHDTE
ncbi:hypothetical protein V497_00733 [Pseudogymnoascus sp. VKM F-4516 (FW-969)]|nr:hypothetical protein V497_00733 [Pseudogymnoascus sp. VKM F-4516 (FW-969)]